MTIYYFSVIIRWFIFREWGNNCRIFSTITQVFFNDKRIYKVQLSAHVFKARTFSRKWQRCAFSHSRVSLIVILFKGYRRLSPTTSRFVIACRAPVAIPEVTQPLCPPPPRLRDWQPRNVCRRRRKQIHNKSCTLRKLFRDHFRFFPSMKQIDCDRSGL